MYKKFSILLILLMVITPVSAAFVNCSGMDGVGEEVSLAPAHHHGAEAVTPSLNDELQSDQVDKVASYDDCSRHVCACGIFLSAQSGNLSASFSFSDYQPSFLLSFIISPDIKPPSSIA
ncbi:MAG: hypothetical protein DRQ61_08030 [Gammaproteobacteria bacterium]|nr:MAG: hypothetical protein DRQ56_03890 [Gammaproteobacteria bacterium]RLA21740.1 MAG: hypothetical protein DRQ61_08030 [Gammaproteobacteria bacterium]